MEITAPSIFANNSLFVNFNFYARLSESSFWNKRVQGIFTRRYFAEAPEPLLHLLLGPVNGISTEKRC